MELELADTDNQHAVLPYTDIPQGNQATINVNHVVELRDNLQWLQRRWADNDTKAMRIDEKEGSELVLFTRYRGRTVTCSVCGGSAKPAVDLRYVETEGHHLTLFYCNDCVEPLVDAIDSFIDEHTGTLLGQAI